jgi:hypothetical protein
LKTAKRYSNYINKHPIIAMKVIAKKPGEKNHGNHAACGAKRRAIAPNTFEAKI